MVGIGDEVVVDFDIDGIFTECKGEITGKGKKKNTWEVSFEDGDLVDVPVQDVKPLNNSKGKKKQEGMGNPIIPMVHVTN
jgi:hypothetical protein